MATISNGESGLSVRNKLNEIINRVEGNATITNNLSFGDDDKAIFGAGSDLQIYHDGSHSYIHEQGTGNLRFVAGDRIQFYNNDQTELYAQFINQAQVELRYDNATKFATTSTGIDVTGTVTADGLTVDGDGSFSGTVPRLTLFETDLTDGNAQILLQTRELRLGSVTDAGASFTDRFKVNVATGDISFYEDTGTTAKFFWDASAESLGIGTSSPSAPLEVNVSGAGDVFKLTRDAGSAGELNIDFSGANANFNSEQGGYNFETSSATNVLVLSSSGNVGIGDSTPSQKLDVNGNVRVTGGYIEFSGDTSTPSAAAAIHRPADNTLAFSTLNSERMRIDDSGNLLVGTTSTTVYTSGSGGDAGINLRSDGQISNSSNSASVFNRMASDGPIHQFRKDGSTVGSIGTSGGDVTLDGGSGHTGIRIGNSGIWPQYNGSLDNGLNVDLGYASGRFRDLYLSGGVYLGGTGSANKLDEYEEGTWTPAMGGTTTNPTVSYSSRSGKYTKIGRLVHLYFYINISSYSGGSGLSIITGMPFGGVNEDAVYFYYGGGSSKSLDKGALQSSGRIVFGQDAVGGIDFIQCSQMNAGGGLIIGNVTYTTS